MKFELFEIAGLLLLKPQVYEDVRGCFYEAFSLSTYRNIFDVPQFIQDNESKSIRGVLRGLHFQKPPFEQAKLVRCIQGEVLDIAVDLRKGSQTYGKSQAVLLSGKTKHQFFVPRGFAHGFIVLSEEAIFSYKVDNVYSPEFESGIRFDDPSLKLDWKLPSEKLLLSDKDKVLPYFHEIESPF
nr:dTDP-4-dehydrorhamnose 3,5-epimerase [uncultured Draconibacterium sp.]